MKKQLAVSVGVLLLLGVSAWQLGVFGVADPAPSEPITASGGSPDATPRPRAQRVRAIAEPEPERRKPAPAVDSRPRVRVIDGITKAPVPTADVRFAKGTENAEWTRLRRLVTLRKTTVIESVFRLAARIPLDADGSFAVDATAQSGMFLARDGERQGKLVVTEPTETSEHVLELWPIQTARVTVRDTTGRSLAAVPVALCARLETDDTNPIAILETGTDGKVDLEWDKSFANLFPGTSTLEVALAFPGAEHVCARVAAEPDRVQDITLTCPPAGTVEVVVATPRGPAPDGLIAYLGRSYPRRRLFSRARAFANETERGVAEFWPVAVGTMLQAETVWKQGTRAFMTTGEGPSRAGESVLLRIDMTGELRAIRGRVVDTAGHPVAGGELDACIRSAGQSELPLRIETDSLGRFSFETVVEPKPGLTLELTDLERGLEASVPVTLPAGTEPIDVGDVKFGKAKPLGSGIVLDEDGQPVPGAIVRLVQKADKASDRKIVSGGAKTDARGGFELFGEPPQPPVWITVLTNGRWCHEQPWTPGEHDTRVVVRRGVAFGGRLAAASPLPFEGISVKLWPEALGRDFPGYTLGWVGAPVSPRGEFSFNALAPGRYTLVVCWRDRFEMTRVTGIQVGSGTTRDPRVDPLDLTQLVRVITVHTRNEAGDRVTAQVSVVIDGRVRSRGVSGRPLLLPRGRAVQSVLVNAPGYVPVDLDSVDGERDVVLRAFVAVRVRVLPVWRIEKSYVLTASLVPIAQKRAGAAAGRGGIGVPLDSEGGAKLFAPPGRYRVAVALGRRGIANVDRIEVTRKPAPTVEVSPNRDNSVTVVTDQLAVNRAIAELRRRHR